MVLEKSQGEVYSIDGTTANVGQKYEDTSISMKYILSEPALII